MKYLDELLGLIALTAKGDAKAEESLRSIMARAAYKAPRHSLLKMCRFFADEIYPDADRDAAEEN